MKYEYSILTFKLLNVKETETWINTKGESGFKVINIHYHKIDGEEYIRLTLERGI